MTAKSDPGNLHDKWQKTLDRLTAQIFYGLGKKYHALHSDQSKTNRDLEKSG
jgi:hypothetical protein